MLKPNRVFVKVSSSDKVYVDEVDINEILSTFTELKSDGHLSDLRGMEFAEFISPTKFNSKDLPKYLGNHFIYDYLYDLAPELHNSGLITQDIEDPLSVEVFWSQKGVSC